jgi:glutaminyl-peptide cyclotransferase
VVQISNTPAPASSKLPQSSPADPVLYTYEVVNAYPHDRRAFTQGLVWSEGNLLESTGLNGESSLRRVDLKTGMVIQRVDLATQYFAEGLTVIGSKVYQVTWQNHTGFVYDLKSFYLEREFRYAGEGWGLTTDGRSLILSDGTAQIRFLDPASSAVQRIVQVTYRGGAVDRLNELEYVRGEVFANVWGSDDVVRIDPVTGMVIGLIDFSGLLRSSERAVDTDVFNGIAYDSAGNRLFVTGKRWPKLFEVRVKRK